MKKFLRFGNILVILLFGLLVFIALEHFNYIPHKSYTDQDFNIKYNSSDTDFDNDGIEDYEDILDGAKEFIAMKPKYKSNYYDGGYPDDGYYVCTDLIWYALKNAGYNFKELIDNDIKNNKENYDIDIIDANIDFRRVRNINTFLEKYALKLTNDVNDYASWQGGDIVVYEDHIGIVSDKRNKKGMSYIIHHDGHHKYEEDGLDRKKVIGHYRFLLENITESEQNVVN